MQFLFNTNISFTKKKML